MEKRTGSEGSPSEKRKSPDKNNRSAAEKSAASFAYKKKSYGEKAAAGKAKKPDKKTAAERSHAAKHDNEPPYICYERTQNNKCTERQTTCFEHHFVAPFCFQRTTDNGTRHTYNHHKRICQNDLRRIPAVLRCQRPDKYRNAVNKCGCAANEHLKNDGHPAKFVYSPCVQGVFDSF